MKRGILKYGYIVFITAIASIFVVSTSLELYGTWHDEWSGYNASQNISDGVCNVATLRIDGDITTFSYLSENSDGSTSLTTSMTDALAYMKRATLDQNILALRVLIDSRGGSPAASKGIADALKDVPMPVGAYLLDYAASGGYYIATGADTIMASPFTDVGSIGVTMSYLDYSKQNEEQGLEFVSLASGKYKDSGTPDRPLTDEERILFERDLKIHHETFVNDVALNRGLTVEEVSALADGSTLPAPLALEKKLIDSIGTDRDMRAWFATELGKSPDDIVFCEPQ